MFVRLGLNGVLLGAVWHRRGSSSDSDWDRAFWPCMPEWTGLAWHICAPSTSFTRKQSTTSTSLLASFSACAPLTCIFIFLWLLLLCLCGVPPCGHIHICIGAAFALVVLGASPRLRRLRARRPTRRHCVLDAHGVSVAISARTGCLDLFLCSLHSLRSGACSMC